MTNGRKTRCEKKEKQKNLEVLELLNDEKKRKQRSDEREEVKTQNCFICVTKNPSEKLSNQVVIETERKHFS